MTTISPALARPSRSPATAAAVAALLAGALAAGAQEPETAPPPVFSGTAQVTAVELVVEVRDAAGSVPADLGPGDFEVLEEGERVELIGAEIFRTAVAPTAGPAADAAAGAPGAGGRRSARAGDGGRTWRLVIWFDQELASSRSIRRAAEALAAQAGSLTALGPVEIVVSGDAARTRLPPTRSSPLVERTLLDLARDVAGRDRLREIRRRYVDNLQLKGELDGRNMPQTIATPTLGNAPGQDGQTTVTLEPVRERGAVFSRRTLARESVAAERMLLERRQDLLLEWLARQVALVPQALILVNDGWDLDPRDFYLAGAPADASFFAELAADFAGEGTGEFADHLARTLAAAGWVSISVASGALEAGSTFAAEYSGHGRLGEIVSGSDDAVSEIASSLVVRPTAPLDAFSDATGGETLTGVNALPRALGRLGDRVLLTYQVARPPDARLRRIEVRSLRPGLEVKAPRWSGAPPGEALAAARARALLAGDPLRGDLPLTAALGLEPAPEGTAEKTDKRRGALQARIDLTPVRAALAAAASSSVRATIAVSFPSGPPFVRQQTIDGQRLAGLTAWTYTLPLTLPAAAERVAVVLEETATGAWGGGLAAFVEGPLPAATLAAAARDGETGTETPPGVASESSDAAAILDLLPAEKPLLLLPPAGEPALGRVVFEPLVAAPEVARVEYRLDGARAAERDRPPFEAALDLGPLPVARTVEAIAFDADGRELGRDSLAINAGAGPFGVRFIEPRSTERVGVVDVEAEVTLPADAELERVEIFWNDRRVASLFAPPFRQRVLIPPEAPVGYLTVVAHRAGGTTVEDVLLMNAGGSGEAVEVRLVELATVVTDAAGRPVEDLSARDFRVLENGVEQELAAVRDGSELPLTLGLVLDSSASLYEEIASVQSAAIDFLGLTLDPADRAFVVDFDSEPRLAADLTGDLGTLTGAVASLQPGGASALCDALVFALARLQRVKGRRAVVLLSDGVGAGESVSIAACQRFVARSGVPVYLLLVPDQADPGAARRAAIAERAGKLVESSGGRVLELADLDRLGAVYREVQAELRSQYVLSFYARPGGAAAREEWRRIEVHVREPGWRARAPAGYYP